MIDLVKQPDGSYISPQDPGEPGCDGHKRISVTEAEAERLQELFGGMTEVLEIGMGLGVSTRALAGVVRQVISIETDIWAKTNIGPTMPMNVVCVGGVSGPPTMDGAFIDGNHRQGSVEADIRLALSQLAPGGLLVLHDFNAPDVQAAAKACGLDGIVYEPTQWGLGVWRKPE